MFTCETGESEQLRGITDRDENFCAALTTGEKVRSVLRD